MKRNLEIQIDIKKIDDEKGYEIGNSIVTIMLKIGGRLNHSRQICEIPKYPQLFGRGFFDILHQCREYVILKNIDGCYAFEIDDLDPLVWAELNALQGVAEGYTSKCLVMIKDDNIDDIKDYLSENGNDFDIISNKNNGISNHISQYYTVIE